MISRVIPIVVLLTGLAACGGSSDGSSVNPVQPPALPNAEVLNTFENGSGVIRSTLTVDGQEQIANAIVSNAKGFVDEINKNGLKIDTVSFESGVSDGYGTFYTGTSTINGEQVTVFEVSNKRGPSWIILAGSDATRSVIAGGAKVSNIPIGSYVYQGTNVVTRSGVEPETGTFRMGVNFTTGTADIDGSTTGTTGTTIIGDMTVNNKTGTFAGDNLLLMDGLDSTSATIQGNFHGNGATAVSGVYHDNSPEPVIAGAIAGSRSVP